MLAKILAGVLAAVAVTGVGVYFALPDYSQPGCCGKKNVQDTLPVSEGSSCCAAHTETACKADAESAACCAVKTSAGADGLSACVGGMASAAPAAGQKKCVTCCDE